MFLNGMDCGLAAHAKDLHAAQPTQSLALFHSQLSERLSNRIAKITRDGQRNPEGWN